MTSGTAYLLGMKKSSGGGNSIGVQLSRSSNQSLPHASTDKAEWNVEDKNEDGMIDSGTSNTDINILEDGWYYMSMYCYVGERDRKSVGQGKSVAVSVDLGGRSIINKKKTT